MLIHDDVLATGSTAAAKAALVEQLGGEVVGLAFLIELSGLAWPFARSEAAARDEHTMLANR